MKVGGYDHPKMVFLGEYIHLDHLDSRGSYRGIQLSTICRRVVLGIKRNVPVYQASRIDHPFKCPPASMKLLREEAGGKAMPLNKRCERSNMDISAGTRLQVGCRRRESMRRILLGLFVLAVCGMMVAPMGMAGKPQQPAPVEPNTQIPLDDSHLQLATVGGGYAYLYGWNSNDKKFDQTWSAVHGACCVLGDVDNDRQKELVVANSSAIESGQGKNKVTIRSYTLRIWENGDYSNGPTYSKRFDNVKEVPFRLAIGDVDGDAYHDQELVVSRGVIDIWHFTNVNGKVSTSVVAPGKTVTDPYALDTRVGTGGLELGDSDNDGVDEIIIGIGQRGYNDYPDANSRAVVVDYFNNDYGIVAFIGSRVVDDITVADLDGDGANEIFMSGATGSKVCIWNYNKDKQVYEQKWQKTIDNVVDGYVCDPYLQSNDAADIDYDGINEIVAAGDCLVNKGATASSHYMLYIWDYNTVSKSWTEYRQPTDIIGYLMDATVSGNFDSTDYNPEIVFENKVLKFERDISGNPSLKTVQSLTGVNAITLG
jgi:hypothetical protein